MGTLNRLISLVISAEPDQRVSPWERISTSTDEKLPRMAKSSSSLASSTEMSVTAMFAFDGKTMTKMYGPEATRRATARVA